MNYTIDSTTFENYSDFARARAYNTSTEILLYGILLVLFFIASYLLYHRTGGARRSFATATAAMAVLATLQLAIHIRDTVAAFQILQLAVQGEVWPHSANAIRANNLYTNLYTVEDFILVTNNLVTDSLFLYRCFMVWGRSVRVVAVPMIMIFTTTLLGYISAYQNDYLNPTRHRVDFRIAFIMSMVTNVVLMGLTAGRIWWIQRDTSRVLGAASAQKYNTVIAIILESGAIYCLTLVLYLIGISLLKLELKAPSFYCMCMIPPHPVVNVFRGAIPQIMNIAPMLIIMRVGLGHGVGDSVQSGSDAGLPVSTLDIRPGHDIDTGAEISLTEFRKSI
ncbi:hypothetical protein C8R44DRAFT_986792 [Mycena epipterygia]|nr:hypothetical protein C8R44DRAFT_986792 [Mycena epipterygia]